MVEFLVRVILFILCALVDATLVNWIMGDILPHLHWGQWFAIVCSVFIVVSSSITLANLD